MLQIEVEIEAGAHLVGEEVQDVYLRAEGLDGALRRDDAAGEVGEEGVDLVVLVLKTADHGPQEVAQLKVAEIRPGVLAAHPLAHLQHGAVIDVALRLCHLQHRALETVGVVHHHAGDDVDEALALLCAQRAHHAEVDPLDAVLRQRELLRCCCVLAHGGGGRGGRRIGRRRLDEHVAGVGVGVIEAVHKDLRGEVVRQERGDALALVVAQGGQEFRVADLGAGDEVLGEDGLAGELAVALRALYLLASGVVCPEAVEVVRLVGEVQLCFRGVLQLDD